MSVIKRKRQRQLSITRRLFVTVRQRSTMSEKKNKSSDDEKMNFRTA